MREADSYTALCVSVEALKLRDLRNPPTCEMVESVERHDCVRSANAIDGDAHIALELPDRRFSLWTENSIDTANTEPQTVKSELEIEHIVSPQKRRPNGKEPFTERAAAFV